MEEALRELTHPRPETLLRRQWISKQFNISYTGHNQLVNTIRAILEENVDAIPITSGAREQ